MSKKNFDIAIIGMAGRLPLADNLDEFHQNLRNGVDSVRPLSEKRKRDTTLPDANYRLLGFIEDIDKFDYQLFGLSKGEAVGMDPNLRLALIMAFQAIENGGYNYHHLNESETGVYYSSPEFEYWQHLEEITGTSLLGSHSGVAPGYISRFFNLFGPSINLNTACSSSLTSLHYACKDLWLGEVDHALVVSTNLSIFPFVQDNLPNLGISAPDGKAKSYSAQADGTGGGEAVGAVFLKPLKEALEDG
ncbi:MAG: polyketide synthase, partial [Bacteroidota bacterium]